MCFMVSFLKLFHNSNEIFPVDFSQDFIGKVKTRIIPAIRNGIAKVNLATEIKDTFMRALKQTLQNSDEIDLRKVFPKATDSVVELLCDKYKMVGSAAE